MVIPQVDILQKLVLNLYRWGNRMGFINEDISITINYPNINIARFLTLELEVNVKNTILIIISNSWPNIKIFNMNKRLS